MVITLLIMLNFYLIYRLYRAKKLEKRIETLEKRADKLDKDVIFLRKYYDLL